MVGRGDIGLTSGRGYYDWAGQDPDAVRSEKDAQLLERTAQVMADWEAEQAKRSRSEREE